MNGQSAGDADHPFVMRPVLRRPVERRKHAGKRAGISLSTGSATTGQVESREAGRIAIGVQYQTRRTGAESLSTT